MNIQNRLLDHLEQAILVIGQDHHIKVCNEAACQLWQREEQKIIGRSLESLFYANDATFLASFEKVLNGGQHVRLNEYQIVFSPTKKTIVEATMTPIFDEQRNVEFAIISIVDHTRSFQLREVEREKAIIHSLSVFVESIAHEIKNPLSSIKGATQLLGRELKKEHQSTTEMILQELARIERLLNELSHYSQMPALEWSSFNVNELLNTVIWFEKNSLDRPISLEVHYDPSLPNLFADRDKLHQVFLNLIRNAVHASPQNGVVSIRTRYCSRWEMVEAQLDPSHEYYLVEIEDQGAGIPEENVRKIFNPLFTTKKYGSGLGLSICFQIVSAHHGMIHYQYANPQGSIFQVYLPRTTSQFEDSL